MAKQQKQTLWVQEPAEGVDSERAAYYEAVRNIPLDQRGKPQPERAATR